MEETTDRKYPSRDRRPTRNHPPPSSTSDPSTWPNAGRPQRISQPTTRIPALTTSRTFGSRSPLTSAHVDLQAFLAKCFTPRQWEMSYTDVERQEILAQLPSSRQTPLHPHDDGKDLSEPPMNPSFCLQDPYLKRAIARFKRDLADGYYEKSWQDGAKRAHQERLNGNFDDYLEIHAQDMFEVKGEGDGQSTDGQRAESVDGDGEYLDSGRKARKEG